MALANFQIIVRKTGAVLLLTALASSVILCAPAQQQQPNTAATNQKQSPSLSFAAASPSQTATGNTAAAANNNGQRQLSSVASELSGMPSLVSLRDASAAKTSSEADELGTFNGKNPFSDDSLWRIPIHFVREQGQSGEPGTFNSANQAGAAALVDSMTKSASELTASADEHDDVLDDDSIGSGSILDHQQQQQPRPSASSSPAVISASTDLKAAAGYHHSTPHHYGPPANHGYGAGHHDGGHYGESSGHHDHYGKYFQYASVPYPHSWDFGYRRGNPYHTIERYEHGKGPHFQTKVKWSDKHGGYGVHVWDYNHDDHHSHHYGGDHHGYDSHGPSHGAVHHGHSAGHYGHH